MEEVEQKLLESLDCARVLIVEKLYFLLITVKTISCK